MRQPNNFLQFSFVFFCCFILSCQTIPHDALKLSPESLAERQLQTRVFETNDEKMILSACAALLQDLGYQIDESETSLGVILASRDRDVTDPAQVAGAVAMAILFGVATPIDKNQKVFASLTTRPLDEKRIAVRIIFQHMVWNTQNQLVKNECIHDAKIYQEFFSKLSKSVFLEAQGL
ncbi:MAG: hypothetical protein N3B18_07595 [Desulfobacterota bacterium]|nr:hypothetical protein [Thermodesulfobacteriota bacterium]